MKEIVTLIGSAFIIAVSFNCVAQEDMINYTLDAKEPIIGCKIVALIDSDDEVGKIESIAGSKLNLRIHKDNVYKITINQEKVYFLQYETQTGFAQVDGIKITRPNEFDSWAINSKQARDSEPGIKYRIQIGAFANTMSAESLKKLGKLYTEEIAGGITRYMIGSFNSQVDAAKTVTELREIGYTEAFMVVCYNGKRVTFDEARGILMDQPSNLTSSSNH